MCIFHLIITMSINMLFLVLFTTEHSISFSVYYSLKSWVDRLSFLSILIFPQHTNFFNFFFISFCYFTFWKISLALIPMSLAYFKLSTFYLFSECSFLYCLILFHEHKIFSSMLLKILIVGFLSLSDSSTLLSLSSFLFPLFISLSVFHHRGLLHRGLPCFSLAFLFLFKVKVLVTRSHPILCNPFVL